MQGITAFTLCVRYIYSIFNTCGLHHNHLFIWLDLKLLPMTYCDEGGLFKFPFGLLEQYSFWVDGIYIDITGKKVASSR
jgi:hypothetical protein